MASRPRTILFALAAVAALTSAACGGREVTPPGGHKSAIEGDWFACEDAACTRIDDDGMRFNNGRWARLDAPGGSYEPGESYEVQTPWGTYSFDGKTLTLTLADGASGDIDGVNIVRIELDKDDPNVAMARVCRGQVCEPAAMMRRVGPGAPIDPKTLGRGPTPIPRPPSTQPPPPDLPETPPEPRR